MLCNLYSFVKMSISYQIITITLIIIMSGTSMLFFILYLFTYGCVGSSLVPRAFFSCGEWGPLPSCNVWLLKLMASFAVEPGLQSSLVQ